MKIKIKEKGKAKEFKLINTWEDVSVEALSKLMSFKEGTKSEEALNTLGALSNIPESVLEKLELSDIAALMAMISVLQQDSRQNLQKIIELEGIKYGFHPDFEEITLGEYADIEQYIKLGIGKHLPEVMAILYRPLTSENGTVYTIAAYDGLIKERTQIFKQMNAAQIQSALVFFYHLGKKLLKTLELYLTQRTKEMTMLLQQQTLQTNGVGSQ